MSLEDRRKRCRWPGCAAWAGWVICTQLDDYHVCRDHLGPFCTSFVEAGAVMDDVRELAGWMAGD